jgi:putative transposase
MPRPLRVLQDKYDYHVVTHTVEEIDCFACQEANDMLQEAGEETELTEVLAAEAGECSGPSEDDGAGEAEGGSQCKSGSKPSGGAKKKKKKRGGNKAKSGPKDTAMSGTKSAAKRSSRGSSSGRRVTRQVQFAMVLAVAEVLLKAVSRYGVELSHFVLMSNHYHMVVRTPHLNLPAFMQYFNARLAETFNRLIGRKGPVWRSRYHGTIIDTDQYMLNVLRYIYDNPRKAGIVVKPLDYGLGTVRFYAFGRPAFVEVTANGWFIKLGDTDEERRERFLRDVLGVSLSDEEREEIRQGLRRQVYGRPEFVEEVREKYLARGTKGAGGAQRRRSPSRRLFAPAPAAC